MTTFKKIRRAALARLEAGEPVHIILQDYADYEDDLRPVLEKASNQSVAPLAMQYPKQKNKRGDTSSAALWMILAGLIALVAALAAAAFIIIPMRIEPYMLSSPVECVGVPQAQITSQYALQQGTSNVRNTMPDGRGGDAFGGVALSEPAAPELSDTSHESTSETAYSGATPSAMPTMAAMPFDVSGDLADDYDETAEYETDDAIVTSDRSEESARSVASDVGYVPPNTEPLRAGEIDDNADWDTYQDYRRGFLTDYGTRRVRDVDTSDRQIIRVVDAAGAPVLNACVQVYDQERHITSALTYATGMTLFFPNLNKDTRYVDQFKVIVTTDQARQEAIIDREQVGGVTTIELPFTQAQQHLQLDVMFLLDATGSMGDEIAQLQGNILKISEQIDALPYDVNVRYGLVSYRDRGDAYVTRVHDFTTSVSEFQDQLLAVQANGGGDYPESLNEGLDMALNAVDWRMDQALRLVFLVADAPPHIDYQDDADYSVLMQDALTRGIKIHPIASGGLEPEGEYILRQIALSTMGKFLFLTYDEGGVGTVGDERPDLSVGTPEDEQGIGDYSVSQLDELVLQLITDELDAINAQ